MNDRALLVSLFSSLQDSIKAHDICTAQSLYSHIGRLLPSDSPDLQVAREAVEALLVFARRDLGMPNALPHKVISARSLNPDECVVFEVSDHIAERSVKPLSVFQVADVAVLGPKGALIVRGDTLLEESVADGDPQTALSGTLGRETAPSTFEQLVAPLHGHWADGFWHWMLEWLPRALVIESMGFRPLYIVPKGGRFIMESLRAIGIEESRVREHEGVSYFAEKVVIVSKFNGYSLEKTPSLLLLLRQKLLAAAPSRETAPSRIYVRRQNPSRPRRIVNESEILPTFEKFNVIPVEMETYSLLEQIALVRNAELIIGPHGAGMVHSLFIKPSSVMIELFSPRYVNPCLLSVSRVLNHRYYLAPSLIHGKEYEFGEDIVASSWFLNGVLERETEQDRYAEVRSKFSV